MAATPAFDLALDVYLAEIFQSGEKTITFGDPPEVPAGTYRLAKEFQVDEGVYNLKIHATGDVTVRIGTSEADMAVVGTFFGGGVVSTQVYMPIGPQRLDFSLSHAVDATPAGITFSIYTANRLIYASAADGWVFDTAGYPTDADVPDAVDPRRLLPVMTLLPNWGPGISERIVFLTDVLESESGQAQTRALRAWPRRQFEAEFLRADEKRSRIDAFIVGLGRRPFLLPLWHEQYKPAAGIAAGAPTLAFPAGTLEFREFSPGDLVLLIGTDPTDYEIVEVDLVDTATDTVTWVDAPLATWPAGSRVIPLRRAQIVEQLTMRNPINRAGVATLRFELLDNETPFTPAWNGPRFDFPANWVSDIQFTYDRVSFTTDNEVGTPYIEDPSGSAFLGSRFSVLLRGREEVVRFRRFIAKARGRARRFFMPTQTDDLTLAANIVGASNEFKALPIGYPSYATRIQEARETVEFVFNDGSDPLQVNVTNVEQDGDLEKYTTEIPLAPITTSQVKRIQFLVPSRFEQDAFELLHHVDEGAAVETQIVTRSIREAVPDELVIVTSPPYPVEIVDGLEGGISLDAGSMNSNPVYVEELQAGISIDNANLRMPIIYTSQLEELQSGISLDDGSLRVALKTVTMDVDSLDPGISIDSGTLVRKLIIKEMDTDSLESGISIDGGSLNAY
jgi:hypothetical protein